MSECPPTYKGWACRHLGGTDTAQRRSGPVDEARSRSARRPPGWARVFKRLEVDALGAARIRCISRQREHRSDGHEEVGWEGVQPPRGLPRFGLVAARPVEAGAQEEPLTRTR